ncbi:hypothetical protein [Dyadobacter sp. OTU695]|uniref:hypothetical protein n=1 Tax=Dyadobacter sp. OTU695 TaxID=3043860 RepID=UPI00313E7F1E
MEKDFGHHGPHIVQIRRFTPENTDYWENVAGINEQTNELIMAKPEDRLTMTEATALLRKLNPTGFAAIYRVVHWHWPEQRA